MARKRKKTEKAGENVVDYRHKNVKRLNIPPAGLTARGEIVREKKVRYAYNPHLSPVLRFDATGKADSIEKMLEQASRRKLEPHELRLLQEALRNHEPWLEWAGKREQQWCVADPVALHIHERISTQAILRVAKRQDVQRDLFADPEQEYREAVQFYKHPMDWTNRMILGDSLAVMASLSRREALAGKVQMIYMDPPYGIKYASNFQPEVGRRDVKEKDEDLTREPEMVKAYRDTWTLGVHSYLSYLRDRLLLCKELLAETGSIFVQIGDENLHRVRILLDEIFGKDNCFAIISFKKTLPLGASGLPAICDYLLWYTKNQEKSKFNALFGYKPVGAGTGYTWIEFGTGLRRKIKQEEKEKEIFPDGSKLFFASALASSGYTPSCFYNFGFEGREFKALHKSWRTNKDGMDRLLKSDRIIAPGNLPCFIAYHEDFPVQPLHNLWDDTHGATDMQYVVQTSEKVIERAG